MEPHLEAPPSVGPPPPDGPLALVDRLLAELSVSLARPDVVREVCAALLARLGPVPSSEDLDALQALAAPLRSRSGDALVPVSDLLEVAAQRTTDPWRILRILTGARDEALARRGLEAAAKAIASGQDLDPRRVASDVSALLPLGSEREASAEFLRALGVVLRATTSLSDPVRGLFLKDVDPGVRMLVARILDAEGGPAPATLAREVVGESACEVLAPYLEYTRASHADLVHLTPIRGETPPCLGSLRTAEDVCGPRLLREVLAVLGWERVALGLEVRALTAVRVNGSIPFFVTAEEAKLFDDVEGAKRVGTSILVFGHGGLPTVDAAPGGDDPVVRYRGYNLAHAEVLREILDVAPLDATRLRRLLERMDRIVADHAALFRSHADECAILPDVWSELKARIAGEMRRQGQAEILSPEVTRLVMAFEDASSLGAVRTLHGLKRYLHQAGLRLGFRLVQAGRATNRTVDVVLASAGRIVRRLEGIRYVDFEPVAGDAGEGASIPYAVRIVIEGFARQLLHERASFPSVRIFCYGNEVHYYLTYGTHPALVRVDFAPPLQGGMVDLEYYGVSRYELEAHPARELDTVRSFFRHLGFDVQIAANTRVHARYDKERARDLGDLCERAEALFRLAPYLMDLDWVVGDLQLRADAKRAVTRAWASRFAAWGGMPLDAVRTRDRLGILTGTEGGPSGEVELPWSGDEPYRDCYEPLVPGVLAPLLCRVSALGIEATTVDPLDPGLDGQVGLERAVLVPLREAVARGELLVTADGMAKATVDRFVRTHETELFTGLLDGEMERLAAAVRLARTVLSLERTLAFRTTGSLNGHEVQRARIPLRGGALGIHVLRGPRGMIRLAVFSPRGVCGRGRPALDGPWFDEASTDVARLATVLRASGYEPSACDLDSQGSLSEARRLRETLRRPNPHARPRLLPGERVADGIAASPGRAVGRVLLGAEGRVPEEFDGRVLVAATLRPEDGPVLARATGIVSTGGGILSHAGLIAAQYRKPALIVSGAWSSDGSGPGQVGVRISEYREDESRIGEWNATIRRDAVERECPVREGDLVVVDADRGALEVMGQNADVLALHDGLRTLGATARRLDRTEEPAELLALRGERLRARHRAAAVLERLADPVLSRFSVREILLGDDLTDTSGGASERGHLLSILLDNPVAGPAAREHLSRVHRELSRRYREAVDDAAQGLPEASTLHEILSLRLRAVRLAETWHDAADALAGCGVTVWTVDDEGAHALDMAAARRLDALRTKLSKDLPVPSASVDPRLRHTLRALARLDALLGDRSPGDVLAVHRRTLAAADRSAEAMVRTRRVLRGAEAGYESAPGIGWKAANLAEVARLAGDDHVPPWFVVTDAAFREALRSRVSIESAVEEAVSLEEAIATVLGRDDPDIPTKAQAIRSLWDRALLPDAVREAIESAYRELGGAGGEDPFVAVRSSAMGEDTEATARAGEFDTFLFVRGAASVTEHVKRAWAGLWNARALDSRLRSGGSPTEAGGGVLVQRMVASRVSGVVQTIHAAAGDPGEIVINAGLGLGEGIVSGAVGADLITVSKEGDLERGPLRFHYIVGDKAEQVVFDASAGAGTVRTETLYHQRHRPALEYVELQEIVAIASRLEAAYHYPLDIEFALEGDRLWVLQARPVPAHEALRKETLERHPLAEAYARSVQEEDAP